MLSIQPRFARSATPEPLVLLEVEADEHAVSERHDAGDTQDVLNYVRALNHGFARLSELPVVQRVLRKTQAADRSLA